jgi:adenine deaminase
MKRFALKGNIADIIAKRFFFGEIRIAGDQIESITELSPNIDTSSSYILPGFIDSHVHIESSMLVPAEFARIAVLHGTVATVSDPHEIANVCGIAGVQYMIDNGSTVNFKFYFGAPSCVPATGFETSGATLTSKDVKDLLAKHEIKYLSEMMNFPGVINDDGEVLQKIKAAHEASKPVDGHSPGLTGEPLKKYVAAGITTDHECFTKEEAAEKLKLGMKILVREGSAARNFEALIDLLKDNEDSMMFCSDDKHPDSLVNSHINELCKRAVEKGIDVFKVLKAACINPVTHYSLDTGTLKKNEYADFIVVKDLQKFEVTSTYINGECVASDGHSNIQPPASALINHFNCSPVTVTSLTCNASEHLVQNKIPVIEALDGQLITRKLMEDPLIIGNNIVPDVKRDILKLVVVNRYGNAVPAKAFIKNFGFLSGAIASSVAHDSHNIIAVGTNDEEITFAINLIIEAKGGISCVNGNLKKLLSLPVAGLMSDEDGFKVARLYTELDQMAKSMGSSLAAPFMTLSFMALLVIPSLKLSDKGLFDGNNFRFIY